MTGTSAQLFSIQCAVWRSENNAAVVTLSRTEGKGDRNVIQLVSMCLYDGLCHARRQRRMYRGTRVRSVSGCTSLRVYDSSWVVVVELSVVSFNTLVDD